MIWNGRQKKPAIVFYCKHFSSIANMQIASSSIGENSSNINFGWWNLGKGRELWRGMMLFFLYSIPARWLATPQCLAYISILNMRSEFALPLFFFFWLGVGCMKSGRMGRVSSDAVERLRLTIEGCRTKTSILHSFRVIEFLISFRGLEIKPVFRF